MSWLAAFSRRNHCPAWVIIQRFRASNCSRRQTKTTCISHSGRAARRSHRFCGDPKRCLGPRKFPSTIQERQDLAKSGFFEGDKVVSFSKDKRNLEMLRLVENGYVACLRSTTTRGASLWWKVVQGARSMLGMPFNFWVLRGCPKRLTQIKNLKEEWRTLKGGGRHLTYRDLAIWTLNAEYLLWLELSPELVQVPLPKMSID